MDNQQLPVVLVEVEAVAPFHSGLRLLEEEVRLALC
jgi:hypothetical protein